MNPVDYVLETTFHVMRDASHVKIDDNCIDKLAKKLIQENLKVDVNWDSGNLHYFEDAKDDGNLTCQYVFLLDTLNFCFWPTPGLEYEHLAKGLKAALIADPNAFNADRLKKISPDTVSSWFTPFTPPQLQERVNKVRELGTVLETHFNGLASNLVIEAKHSAVKLVDLITKYLPGFRDHSVYKGMQIYFYKRAQILVGDLWAAYGYRSEGFCSFFDIEKLTMFADYRVPQLLRYEGVLKYSDQLVETIDQGKLVPYGSEEEVEIRAATIQAVDQLQKAMTKLGKKLLVIQVDWLLWQIGEQNKDKIEPHHRTWTVFY